MTRRAVKCRGIPQLLVVALLVLPLYFTRPSMARSTPTVLRGSGLELVGRDGVAWFRVSRKDGVAVLELSDVSGKTRFSVSAKRGGPCDLAIMDEAGKRRIHGSVAQDGGAAVALLRNDGGSRLELFRRSNAAEAGILLFGQDGKQRAEWVHDENSGLRIRLRDAQQHPKISLVLPNKGEGDLVRALGAGGADSAFVKRR